MVKTEVESGHNHKNGDDPVDKGRIIGAHAGISRREAAGGQCSEGVGERIEEVHAAEHKQNGLQNGEPQIDKPEYFCGLGDFGGDFIQRRAGGFGADQLNAAHAQEGEDCHGEHHDAHAAEPVGQGAPEEHRAGQAFDGGKNGCPGGGKAAHGFEKGIGVGRNCA